MAAARLVFADESGQIFDHPYLGMAGASAVVISDEPVSYPYVVNPEVVIILAQEAYHRYAGNLPQDTLVIIDPDLVKPGPPQKSRLLSVPVTHMAREMGRPVVANIIMLGFLAAVSDVVSPEALRKSILASVPQGTGDFNIKAFELGYKYGLEHKQRK